jgi:hypothetical protein
MLGRSRTRFRLRHRGTLIAPRDGQQVASFNVGPAGEAIVLWTGGPAATISADAPGLDRVVVFLHDPPPTFPTAQTLPDGRFLVVGARAEWRDGIAQNNATIYSPEGNIESQSCVGDGIGHAQVTVDGAIWIGYFDEGVYGNLGWGGAGPRPIGAAGIVRFSSALDVEWEYPGATSGELEPIDDCYALNVIGDDVWACSYSDFDVVRIRAGAVRAWANDVEGVRAIAVSGESIALFGGYANDRDRLVIGSFAHDELEPDVTARLTMPNGRRLPADAVVVGRGEELHLLVDLEWFTWSLADHT